MVDDQRRRRLVRVATDEALAGEQLARRVLDRHTAGGDRLVDRAASRKLPIQPMPLSSTLSFSDGKRSRVPYVRNDSNACWVPWRSITL